MLRLASSIVRAFVGAAVVALMGGHAAAQGNRIISGDWEVITTSSGCKAILSNELELAWGPDGNATFSWSGQCNQNGLITGQGKLITNFTSQEGTKYRTEKTGMAADGMFEGMTSEATYSNADDWNDSTPAGSMQLHDFGDVRNPMPSFYKDGCQHHVSDGRPDMSRTLFDCKVSEGVALRKLVLNPAPLTTPGASPAPSAPRVSAPSASAPPATSIPSVGPRAALSLLGPGRLPGSAPAPAAPDEPDADHTPVSDCLDVEAGVFSNSCTFPVYFTMCNESPKKGSWAESFSCVNAKGKMDGFLDDIGAKSTKSAHASTTGMVYWFACRQPLTPKDVEYKPGEGIFAYCD
jgi:hypothetical protein